jgi:hypothetical protein
MMEILVQVLPDGEELVRVVDERIPEHLVDPRERTIETRTGRPPLWSKSALNAPPHTEEHTLEITTGITTSAWVINRLQAATSESISSPTSAK